MTEVAAEIFDREIHRAETAGHFDQAVGWARMAQIADRSNPQWTGMLGLMLVKAAEAHLEGGQSEAGARLSRQARQVLAPFRYPTDEEIIDLPIERAEEIFKQTSAEVGPSAVSGFRDGIDDPPLGEWISTVDGFGYRMFDWVRLEELLQGDQQ